MPDGAATQIILGLRIDEGMRPQVVVPAGTLQGSRLLPGGEFALPGTTMAPGFEFKELEHGDADALKRRYPSEAALINAFAHRSSRKRSKRRGR